MPFTVLIVDDHPSFRASARTVLEVAGYVVVGEAEDAASAIVAASILKPEVVLLDIQLPDLSGFDVARLLMQRVPGSRVVLTSSRDVLDYGSRVHTSGALGFISKCDLSGDALARLLPATE